MPGGYRIIGLWRRRQIHRGKIHLDPAVRIDSLPAPFLQHNAEPVMTGSELVNASFTVEGRINRLHQQKSRTSKAESLHCQVSFPESCLLESSGRTNRMQTYKESNILFPSESFLSPLKTNF